MRTALEFRLRNRILLTESDWSPLLLEIFHDCLVFLETESSMIIVSLEMMTFSPSLVDLIGDNDGDEVKSITDVKD